MFWVGKMAQEIEALGHSSDELSAILRFTKSGWREPIPKSI